MPATSKSGRVFYVDSNLGSDSNDGLGEQTASGGSGPWRSLARVLSSTLGPGDVLQLACGSQWREALRIPTSGTAAKPVFLSAPAAGCATRPTIDGSISLPASSWVRHQGNVFKASLASPALLLTSSAANWAEAHHPNRGHSTADPNSPYLSLSANGNVIASAGGQGSNVLPTGSELQLPLGASLGAGTRLRLRTYSWLMDESPVSAFDGTRMTLSQPTSYPALAGVGYVLLGQLWMADSAGEWFYDPASKLLYANMPGGVAPTVAVQASVLPVGIDLKDRSHVVVEGLAVRNTGVGADIRGSVNVAMRNLALADLADQGIDASGSSGLFLESSSIVRTGGDAVAAWRTGFPDAGSMTVRNNLIQESGVRMQGEQVVSVPRRTYAAIYAGPSSTVTGNVIINAGYIGIRILGDSLVANNLVYGACSVLDDCAGIYIWGNRNSVVRNNTVVVMRGAISGKPANERFTSAQGIYLDDYSSGVLVEGNTVTDADHGILIHDSASNTLRNNRLYANRRGQIWLQNTNNRVSALGDIFGNLIDSNQMAAVTTGASGVMLETNLTSTAGFGTIDRNRYFDRAVSTVLSVRTSQFESQLDFARWRMGAVANLPGGRDAGGVAASNEGFTSVRVTGGNLVPNGGAAVNAAGWATWNQVAPMPQLVRENCTAGVCLRFVPGGSNGLVSSPNFSVQAGQWYRLSIDLSAETDNQPVQLLVRRGGGGSNGYESLADRSLTLTAGRAWQRYNVVFQAIQTITASNPVTQDLGARVDIEGLVWGKTVSLANLELVPVTQDPMLAYSALLANAGSSARAWNCPLPSQQAPYCNYFRRLSDGTPVSWPMSVAGLSSEIIYLQDPLLLDSDGDGIADSQDLCAGTPQRSASNSLGCPLTLR